MNQKELLKSSARPSLARRARFTIDPVGGQPTLLYPEGLLALNASGREILDYCDGHHTLGQIVAGLAERHAASVEQVGDDVVDFLARLQQPALIEGLPRLTPKASRPPPAARGTVQPARPLGLLAELTYRCPLHCPYCSNPLIAPRASQELTTETWRRVIDQAAALGVLQIHYSGGEPLLRSDLSELVAAGRERGLYTNLITSAIGLSEARAAELAAAGLESVQISLQSDTAADADAIAGFPAHAAKLAAARRLQALGLPLTVNVVLHRGNLGRVAQLIELAERLGAVRLELASAQYYGWAARNQTALLPTRAEVERAEPVILAAQQRLWGRLELLYVLPDYFADRPKPCMGGWGRRSLTVNPAGDVLPCPTAGEIGSLRFENVREHDLTTIWRDSASFNRFRGTAWMPEPCQSCALRDVDFGGCRCQAARLTGDPANTDPACGLSPHRAALTDRVDAAGVRATADFDARSIPAWTRSLEFRRYVTQESGF